MSDTKALAVIMLVVDPEHPEAVETLTGTHTYLIDELEEAIQNPGSAVIDGASIVDIGYGEMYGNAKRRADGKLELGMIPGQSSVLLDGAYSKQELAAILFEMTRQEVEEQS